MAYRHPSPRRDYSTTKRSISAVNFGLKRIDGVKLELRDERINSLGGGTEIGNSRPRHHMFACPLNNKTMNATTELQMCLTSPPFQPSPSCATLAAGTGARRGENHMRSSSKENEHKLTES